MNPVQKIKRKLKIYFTKSPEKVIYRDYYSRYKEYSFVDGYCVNEKQFEASITRLYHTIEKGLSYLDYRPGFGKDNIETLVSSLESYSKKYSTDKFFYKTALSVLNEYISKNKKYNVEDPDFNKRVSALPGSPNNMGGTIAFNPLNKQDLKSLDFKALVESRHSIRHFSNNPVEMAIVVEAIELAQYTPSACNRQGWKTYIIDSKDVLAEVLKNQNGNRGFGHEIDKLIVVTGDLRCFNRDREIFQAFVDGGMYAMRLLDSLYYKGIASVPLSASLRKEQEDNVRHLLNLDPAEILILFIGIGNYPEVCQVPRSERKPADYTVI